MTGRGWACACGRARHHAPGQFCRCAPALRTWAAALLTAAMACALAGCMAQAPARRAWPTGTRARAGAGAAVSPGPAMWLLTRSALAQLVTDPLVRSGLARSRVYEILQPGQLPLAGVDAIPVVTFPAVAALDAALTGNQLPAGTRAVLYDPEAWSFTPADEQRDPLRAAARAASLARAHGLQIIVAPALNLTTVLTPDHPGPRWQQFLRLRLAAGLARIADVIDLQAQSLERSTATYASFVRAAAGQARAANPDVQVVAGLSTNPPGAAVSGPQLTAVIRASHSAVDGYWLNIPGPGPRCPTCNPARPDVGIAALRDVL